MNKVTVYIKGMHCRSCELLIEESLKKLPGVGKINADYKKGKVEITFVKDAPSGETIRQAVKDAGYDVGFKDKTEWISRDKNDYINLLKGAAILIVLYLIATSSNLFNIGVNTESESLLVVLLIGLAAGFSTCMALVGGLVLSISAQHAEAHPEISTVEKFRPHLYFNLGRIAGFGFLGGTLALLGSAIKPSAGTLGVMTVIIGGVMIFLGLKLIEIFPALKDKSLTLPKGVSKFFGLKKEQKEYSHKGSFITGALTFFLPCGFTQAMQLYAISSGSFFQGALIMSLFAAGTAPGLLGVGGLASVFKGKKARLFFATTGLAVILLGWINISNGSQLVFQGKAADPGSSAGNSSDVQEIRMDQTGWGYFPNEFTVVKGKKVKWIITSKNQFSCDSAIVVPKYGISKNLVKGENIIEFVPAETGEITFSCSMGMYRGKITVVDSAENVIIKNNNVSVTPVSNIAANGSCGGAGGGGCGGCGGGGTKRNLDANVTLSKAGSGNEQVIKAEYTVAKDISPNNFEVKKGVPVRFEIDVKESGRGCMGSLMVQGLYNNAQYLQGGNKMVLNFTPEKEGSYNITCAMGVPRGVIKVVN